MARRTTGGLVGFWLGPVRSWLGSPAGEPAGENQPVHTGDREQSVASLVMAQLLPPMSGGTWYRYSWR